MDGTAFPTTARLTGRWLRGRLPTINDWVRGIPFVDKKVREQTQRRKGAAQMGLATAYCAETVAITYEEMGLLVTDKEQTGSTPAVLERGHAAAGAGLPAGRRNRGLGRPGRPRQLVDRHLPHLGPARRVEGLADDFGCRRQRPRQLLHGVLKCALLTSIRPPRRHGRLRPGRTRPGCPGCATTRTQVARFRASRRGELRDRFREALGTVRFRFELHDDKDHQRHDTWARRSRRGRDRQWHSGEIGRREWSRPRPAVRGHAPRSPGQSRLLYRWRSSRRSLVDAAATRRRPPSPALLSPNSPSRPTARSPRRSPTCGTCSAIRPTNRSPAPVRR